MIEGVFLDSFPDRMCTERKRQCREEMKMRGYYTGSGYYGLVNGRYVLFASESDYFDAMEEEVA